MLVEPKKFSNISFDSISKCHWPNLLFHHDAQSMKVIFILSKEKDEISRGQPCPTFDHLSEILRMGDPFFFCKSERPFHGDPQYSSIRWFESLRHRNPIAFILPSFFYPSFSSFLKHFSHFWYPFASKNHGSFFAGDCSADTFFSLNSSFWIGSLYLLKHKLLK